RSFGFTEQDFVIRLSSRNAWQDLFQQRQGDAAQEYAFYQIIDKLERETPEQSDEKLRRAGFSLAEVSSFIEQGKPTAELDAILKNLTARGLSDYVKIDYHVIRGLAYYTGVVFEAFDRQGEFRAIAGGGRYDNLLKLISGGAVDLPALGFGMGDVVLLEFLKARALLPKFEAALDAFCLIEDEDLRAESLKLTHDLRAAGLAADYSLTPAKSDKQFKRARELNAAHTIKLERNQAGELLARIKDLKTRQETVVPAAEAAGRLREPRAHC
ncbi:MAG: ATP phosphoribosyltransferase regulatory subunit, partial [Verrucomicrobiota bacterium]